MQRFTKEAVMLRFAVIVVSILFVGCGEESAKKEIEQNSQIAPTIKVEENAVNTNVKDHKKKNSDGGQFYYSLNSEKNQSMDESQNSKSRTTIDAYLHIKSPYERVKITMMIKKLSQDYVIKCSPCHDDYANGVIGPSLLDKDGDFIYHRIMDFKSGKRKNVLMKELVSQMDDKKLKKIANEIAKFNKQIRKMRDKK
jgi:hypothetical protein